MTPPAVHTRIDHRLLHGQVVQFWIPFLDVGRLIIADDDVSDDRALLAVYRKAVPADREFLAIPVEHLSREIAASGPGVVLALLGDVSAAARARRAGFRPDRVVVGNVPAGAGRRRVTDAVHLSADETEVLAGFVREGTEVLIQTLPGETLSLVVDDEDVPRWSKD